MLNTPKRPASPVTIQSASRRRARVRFQGAVHTRFDAADSAIDERGVADQGLGIVH